MEREREREYFDVINCTWKKGFKVQVDVGYWGVSVVLTLGFARLQDLREENVLHGKGISPLLYRYTYCRLIFPYINTYSRREFSLSSLSLYIYIYIYIYIDTHTHKRIFMLL